MTTYAERVVELAISYVPMREIGSDDVLFNDHIATPWFGYKGEWCDAFVSSIFEQAGCIDAAGGRFLYTPSHYTRLKNLGRQVDIEDARAGDIIFFDWDFSHGNVTQHVGIVRGDYRDGIIPTVEGNTSSGQAGSQFAGGGVHIRNRGRAGVRGVFRPAFPEGEAPKPFGLIGAGCTGDRVKAVQKALGLEQDGHYGPATRGAVKRYQITKKVGLFSAAIRNTGLHGQPKGFVDEETWKSLVPEVKPVTPTVSPIAEDGYLGTKTWARLRKVLSASSNANAVKYVQKRLNEEGFKGHDGKALVVDGKGLLSNAKGETEKTNTIYALSCYYGHKNPSGTLDSPSDTVKRLQKDLNKGVVIP